MGEPLARLGPVAFLLERLAAAEPAGFLLSLDSEDGPSIQKLCDERPANRFLRQKVYAHLVARGRIAVLEEVAQAFALRPDATVEDLRAWLAAWNARVVDAGEAEPLAEAALAAVVAHPADAELCYLLALVYEKAQPADAGYALACYQRVLAIQTWGPVADAARDAIERLNR